MLIHTKTPHNLKMRFTLFIILIFLCNVLMAGELNLINAKLPHNRTIIITGHPDYSPVIWATSSGQSLQGVGVELLEMIFKEINVTIKIKNVETWGRAQEEVKNGRIDVLVPPYKTNERLVFYEYTAAPFMNDETVIFVKKGKEFPFRTLEDLKRHKGVAIINDSFGSQFDEYAQKNLNILHLSKTELCFNFVNNDRASYIVAGLNSGNAALVKLNLESKFTVLPKKIITTGLFIALSKNSKWNIPEVKSFLDRKIKEYSENGTIKSLEIKYNNVLRQENLIKK